MTTYTKFKEYIWLVNTIYKARRITLAEINEHVLREDTVQNWMLSTLSVGNVISEGLSLQDKILLETASSGGEYLPQVIEAMKKSVRVKGRSVISKQPFLSANKSFSSCSLNSFSQPSL